MKHVSHLIRKERVSQRSTLLTKSPHSERYLMKKLSLSLLCLSFISLSAMKVVLPEDLQVSKTGEMSAKMQLDFQNLLIENITKTMHHHEWRPVDMVQQINKRLSDLQNIQERFSPREHRLLDGKVDALRILLKQQYYLLVGFLNEAIQRLNSSVGKYHASTPEEQAQLKAAVVDRYTAVNQLFNALRNSDDKADLSHEQARIEAARIALDIH